MINYPKIIEKIDIHEKVSNSFDLDKGWSNKG